MPSPFPGMDPYLEDPAFGGVSITGSSRRPPSSFSPSSFIGDAMSMSKAGSGWRSLNGPFILMWHCSGRPISRRLRARKPRP